MTEREEPMLRLFAEAGEWGIERQFVPTPILYRLQERGFVTTLEATPRITEAGWAHVQEMERLSPGYSERRSALKINDNAKR